MARKPAISEIEPLPEADRLESFPHPRETKKLFGHDDAQRSLCDTFATGHLHHGWLIAGPPGIGKATLAYRFANYALATAEERNDQAGPLSVKPGARTLGQVRALSHPGLLTIRRIYDTKTKRFPVSIRIDDVRRLRGFLSRSAESGAWRVVIVDSADELNINAANALLKSLEEPPPRTVFLLITAQPGRLLATIRSRCRRLDLLPLGEADLMAAVDQANSSAEQPQVPEQDWPALLPLAGGSVRRVLTLRSTDGIGLHESARELVSSLKRLDWGKVHTLADQLSPVAAAEKFTFFTEILTGMLARLIRARAAPGGSEADHRLAVELIREPDLASWAALWETIAREKARVAALNLDRKSFILETFVRLEAQACSRSN